MLKTVFSEKTACTKKWDSPEGLQENLKNDRESYIERLY